MMILVHLGGSNRELLWPLRWLIENSTSFKACLWSYETLPWATSVNPEYFGSERLVCFSFTSFVWSKFSYRRMVAREEGKTENPLHTVILARLCSLYHIFTYRKRGDGWSLYEIASWWKQNIACVLNCQNQLMSKVTCMLSTWHVNCSVIVTDYAWVWVAPAVTTDVEIKDSYAILFHVLGKRTKTMKYIEWLNILDLQ